MLTREQNELLCRVEGDAAMGQLMRRHWLPLCMSEEVLERDGAPVRARLLGERLVAFRDTNGRLGVLGEFCPHRNASLSFGRNEQCGLRCLYHGWKFDVDGNVVDMASEPDGSALKKAVKHKAYPARESGGFVWIWMGPAAEMREFEPPAWAPHPDCRTSIVKMHAACTGRRCWRARSIRRTAPACTRPRCPRRRWTAPRRPARYGRGRPTTRRRACSSSRPATASATRPCAGRSSARKPASTCAPRCSSRRSRC